jgi:Mannosyltransferase (PIG-V)
VLTLWGPFAHWDGGWYMQIVRHGYAALRGPQQPAAFLPLFPAVVAALHRLVPGLAPVPAGILVNVAATCAAMCLVDRSVAQWPRRHRLRLATFLLTVPAAFFYVAFYAEALFLLGVSVTVWALTSPDRRLWWAPLGIGIATLDRAPGVLLVIPLLAVLVTGHRHRPVRALLVAVASLAGAAITLGVYRLATGDAWSFVAAHQHGWHDNLAHPPLSRAAAIVIDEMLLRPGADVFEAGRPNPVSALGLWVAALSVLAVVATWRWRRCFAVYAAVALAVSLVSGGYESQARYAAVIVPMWMGVVALARHHRAGRLAITLATVLGLATNLVLMYRFVAWRWAG